MKQDRPLDSLNNKCISKSPVTAIGDYCHRTLPQFCVDEIEGFRELALGFLAFIFIHLISNCFQNKVMRLSMQWCAVWGQMAEEDSPTSSCFLQASRGTEALGVEV